MNNLMFLSQGMQIAMLLLLVGLVLVFLKSSTLEQRIKNMEDNATQYVSYEDYMETFNNMWDEKSMGGSVAPFEEVYSNESEQ